MFIRSNVISQSDIYRTFFTATKSIDAALIDFRSFKPRHHDYGYEMFAVAFAQDRADGKRRRDSAHSQGYKALTWDEFGQWMAMLFEIDPDAIVAWYKGKDDFMEKTNKYQPRGMKAPWLKAWLEARAAAYWRLAPPA